MPFDGSESNAVIAHLLRAKEYIARHGWCHGAAANEGGGVCAARAIGNTRGPCTESDDPFEFFKSAISCRHIGRWNDASGRTLDEVNDAFDRAIELAFSEKMKGLNP